MKILIDMNLSPAWVYFFDKHNIIAHHWSKIGKLNDPDTVILTTPATMITSFLQMT